jgi:hypothetical protein
MPTRKHANLSDPYARLGERVRRQILPHTVGKPTVDRLLAILKAAIQGQDPIPPSRLNEIIYVVLNHPPLMSDPVEGDRHFVAAINWTNVQRHAPKTVQHLRSFAEQHGISQTPTGCKLWIFPADGEDTPEDAANYFWHSNWGKYLAITQDGVKQNKYTWNQLLLKEAAHPFPLGLYWKDYPRSEIAGPYFQLTQGLAGEIGLPNPDSPEWLSSLLRDVDSIPAAFESYPALDPLLALFNDIDRAGEDIRRPTDVAWAIYYLVRKYAVWGGTAFMSIPILIGAETHGVSRTAVLSICTVKPLSLLAYREWKIIAGVLLRPLVEEEMGDMINKLQFAHAAYDLAHFIKNRTMPLSYALDTLENQVANGLPHDNLRRYLEAVKRCWKRLTDGSNILDVHAHAIETRQKERVFLQEGKTDAWTTSGRVYDIRTAICEFCKLPRPQNLSQVITLEFQAETQIAIAADWIQGVCRPSDTIYDGILEEVVINAARHSNVDPLQLRVGCVPTNNVTEGMPGHNGMALVVSNFCISRFLDASNLSNGLFFRVDPERDNNLGIDGIRFSVAIPFNGLQIRTNVPAK